MVMSWLKDNFQAAKKAAMDEIGKFKNAKFHEAVIAGCAKMAYADGIVDPKEKQKMMGFIQNSEILSVFKMEDSIALWKKWAAKYDTDLDFGDMEALSVIGKIKGDEAAAKMLVRVVIMVANSDGNFDSAEVKAAVSICNELGLSPSEFNLTV